MDDRSSNIEKKNNSFHDENYWAKAWVRHIENYSSAPPRCGYWLAARFPSDLSILEIAGGSCHDSRYLATTGRSAIGSDFDQKTLEYLANRYPNSPLKMQREDAFSLSFADKSIDLSFSNGFWVLFSDNEKIQQLIHEQARITRKYLIALVHNVENPRLIKLFKQKSKTDSLYNIRFFQRNEVLEIVKNSGLKYKSITINKFGGTMDRLLMNKVIGVPNPAPKLATKIVPKIYNIQPWFVTERIACVIEL